MEAEIPEGAQEVSGLEALERVFAGERVRKVPVGVIGPRDATEAQLKTAEAIGTRLGQIGLTMICGGKTGVMSAAAKGCHEAGGLSVGLIPDHDWRKANPYIQLPIATGLSEARNMIIAKSCEVLIAIGGSYGTLSEIAFGLHFSKPVIGISGAPKVDGLEFAGSVDDAMERMAGHLLNRVETS
ncbi:TIGR00725 family protein [uncultured Roseibium sp.]|uniref:TIGR00725 family protein n=1 Tax=uncultured Roseibium sp. TaxID=1936171 RepID=UPI00260EA5DC|nr:TIGR00725 family protein [uncultured Roseibium sp.]